MEELRLYWERRDEFNTTSPKSSEFVKVYGKGFNEDTPEAKAVKGENHLNSFRKSSTGNQRKDHTFEGNLLKNVYGTKKRKVGVAETMKGVVVNINIY